ncbi:MAG: Maf-like protein [Acidimicrobiales bacterium]|nr:Maf-like protein [Acidimicrobiales bacterium]
MSVDGEIELVLASASPRRRALLADLGLPFRVVAPDVDESPRPSEEAPTLVARLARAKAQAVAAVVADAAVVLAADTLVALDGAVLGKPVDAADARAMLRRLSGTRHQVLTGVALSEGHRITVEVATSTVAFGPLSDDEIDDYVATGEPLDKAGAYAIQGEGDRFATIVDGTYDNVVGLPLALVRRLLRDAGFQLP